MSRPPVYVSTTPSGGAGASWGMSEDGIAQLRFDLGNAASAARPEIRQVIGAYAQKIRSEAINLMRRGTKTGTRSEMRIKGRKKSFVHTASAPGEAPAIITGRLMNSITAEPVGDGLTAEVGPTVNYGKYLELGTKNMDPRPFMEPALEANIPGLETALTNAIRRALRA